MARREPVREPPAEIAARMPAGVSGNTANGLGETQPRPSTSIVWHHPKRVPAFAAIQQHVNQSYGGHPAPTGAIDTPERRAAPVPVAETGAEDTPEGWTRRLKEFALSIEADLVGIARVDPTWVFEGYEKLSRRREGAPA